MLRCLRWGRRRIYIARRNGVFGNKISDRVGDLLFFLLFLQPPASKTFLLPRDLFVVALNFCSLSGDVLIDLRLNVTVLFVLARFQFFGCSLLNALISVQRAVSPDRVLDDL